MQDLHNETAMASAVSVLDITRTNLSDGSNSMAGMEESVMDSENAEEGADIWEIGGAF